MDVSIIVPTRDRPRKLAALIRSIEAQASRLEIETIVVDDGSCPPLELPEGSRSILLRLDGVERSAARNAGARIATGRLLLFLDDDLTLTPDFVEQHWRALQEWPDALLVGDVRLPSESLDTPFGRFRAELESHHVPARRGPVARRNFCTAANLAVSREVFVSLGGFDVTMTSAEDQDLALRHTAAGGSLVFVPEAAVVHHDDALDVRSYGIRAERGAAALGPFLRRYPDWPDNVERVQVNGRPRFGAEPLRASLRKSIKALLAYEPATGLLLCFTRWVETVSPHGALVRRLYRLVLGVHLYQGFRRSLGRGGDDGIAQDLTFRRAS